MQILFFILKFNEKKHNCLETRSWQDDVSPSDRRNLPQNKRTINTAQVLILKLTQPNYKPQTLFKSTKSIIHPLLHLQKKKFSTHLLCARPWVQSADWNSRLSSKWSPRRYKDVNPQWNFLIPATCHCVHRLRWVENSQWASGRPSFTAPPTTRPVWRWVEDVGSSLASTGIGCVVCLEVGVAWGEVGWLPSGKAPHGFCVAEGAFIERANVAGAAPMLFLFSALRTFGICVRASQRSSSIAFPPSSPTSSSSHPSPKFWTCRAATHLHQNEELQGQNASAIFLWQEGPFFPESAESVLHERS